VRKTLPGRDGRDGIAKLGEEDLRGFELPQIGWRAAGARQMQRLHQHGEISRSRFVQQAVGGGDVTGFAEGHEFEGDTNAGLCRDTPVELNWPELASIR
jgi:hypothetical protein